MATSPDTITAPLPGVGEGAEPFVVGLAAWSAAAEAAGLSVVETTHDHTQFPDADADGSDDEGSDDICGVALTAGRWYLIRIYGREIRARLLDLGEACRVCHRFEVCSRPGGDYDLLTCCAACTEAAVTERSHAGKVGEALTGRGVRWSFPDHLDTVWVPLADGSTMHIGDEADSMRLHGCAGYSVYRDDTEATTTLDDTTATVMADPDATFEELIDTVARVVGEIGQPEQMTEPTELTDICQATAPAAVRLTAANGLVVEVRIEETPEGPRLELAGVNCRLDGDLPGCYRMVSTPR